MYSRLPLLAVVVVLTGLGAGCGAAKDAINANIPDLDNPLRVNGRSVTATVSRAIVKPTRAAIPARGEFSDTFADSGSVSRADDLTFANVRQSVSGDVSVIVPDGATAPAQFTISGLVMNATIADGPTGSPRSVTATNFGSDGPFNYIRNGVDATGRPKYSFVSGNISLNGPNLGRDETRRLVEILTEGNADSNQNRVSIVFGFDADDTQLPEGTRVEFTFVNGTADVGI